MTVGDALFLDRAANPQKSRPAAAHARQHEEAVQISSLKGDQISAQGFNPISANLS